MFISAVFSSRQLFLENWQAFSNSTHRLLTSNKVTLLALTVFTAFAAFYYLTSRSIRAEGIGIKNSREDEINGTENDEEVIPTEIKTPEKKPTPNPNGFTPGGKNGRGTKEIDKNTFIGTFKNGLLEGPNNLIIFSNGTVWKGFFSEGMLDGEGEIAHSNGDFEKGMFKKSKLHGAGSRKANGVTIIGDFENGTIKNITSLEKHSIVHEEKSKKDQQKMNRSQSFSMDPKPKSWGISLFGKSKDKGAEGSSLTRRSSFRK